MNPFDMAEQFCVWSRFPNKLQLLIIDSPIPLFFGNSREEHGIHSDFSLKHGVGDGVSELVELPTDAWYVFLTKFFQNKLMTYL